MPLLRGPYNARPPAGAAPHSGGRRRKRAGLELLLRNPLFFLIFAVRVSQKFCRATGCGEGYYTAGLFQGLTEAGLAPRIAGVDLSKAALRRAAKRVPEAEFAVASVYHLPLPDRSADVLVNIFSPLAAEEFARVLRPGGLFCYAVPSARHLWEMKEVLYREPYENPSKREDYPGFVWRGVREIRYTADLDAGADIMALFGMTPYAWKTPKEGIRRLEALDRLTCQIGFDLHLYQRK